MSLGKSSGSWGGSDRLLPAAGVLASSPGEVGQATASSSSAAPAAPPHVWESFKKRLHFAKRNANQDESSLIARGRSFVEEDDDEWQDSGRRTPRRRDSRVDSDRVENTEQGNVTAGVARTIFRLIIEGNEVAQTDPQSILFNDDRFFKQPNQRTCRFWCCKVRRREPTPNNIFELLQNILSDDPKFQKELLVISTIYLERLLYDRKGESRVFLSKDNWQPILVTALLMASKVWEDTGPWNMDFIETLRRGPDLELHSCLHLYTMELMFCKCIDWDFCVSGEEYGRYLLALRVRDEETPGPLQEPSSDPRPRFQSFGSEDDSWGMDGRDRLDTIEEDPFHVDAQGIQVQEDSSGNWSVQQTFNGHQSSCGLARQRVENGSSSSGLGGMRSSKSAGVLAEEEEEEEASSQPSGMQHAPAPSSGVSSGMRRASRSSGNLQEGTQSAGLHRPTPTTSTVPSGLSSGMRRASRSSGNLQETALSGMRKSAGSSGHLSTLASQDSSSSGLRHARSMGSLSSMTQHVPGMVRRRSYGRLTEDSAPPAVRIRGEAELRDILAQKSNWLDRKNPLLGLLRHALPASAPSRHIGDNKRTHLRRLSSSLRMSMSCSTFEGLCLSETRAK